MSRGHEGERELRPREIAKLTREVYAAWAEESARRYRFTRPTSWPKLFRIERQLWILEITAILQGHEPANSREPWERDLIMKLVRPDPAAA